MQGNVNNVQECIEMRLSEQKEALERLTEQVAQGHSRINDLESSTTALLVTAREERQRIQDQCVRNHTVLREEMHGQTEQLQLRLEQVEEATATLSSRIDTLSNECTQVAEKAADCRTVQLCQRVESQLNNQFSVQQHLESQVKELERRFQGLDTDQFPRLPTQPSDNPVHSNRGANGPAESLVTQTSERPVLNATVGGLTIDQAALLHHPARQWSESMPTFTGKATENPIRFLNKFEEYARTFGLNDTEKLKCLGSALRGNAFYWYEMLQTTTTSYQQFIDMFRQQYWSLRTQGNLRAQLHTERYDPKKGMSLEAHISSMYERTRYLDLVMSDDEFIATVLTQLPLKYQIQLAGRTYGEVGEFREQLLMFDKLERLNRSQTSREETERSNAYQKHVPMHNTWQNRDVKTKDDRRASVNYMNWQYQDENPYHKQFFKGQYQGKHQKRRSMHYRKKTWWSSNRNHSSDHEGERRNQFESKKGNNRRSPSPELRTHRESDRRRRAYSEDEYDDHRKYFQTSEQQRSYRAEYRLPSQSPTEQYRQRSTHSAENNSVNKPPSTSFPPPFTTPLQQQQQLSYFARNEPINPIAASFQPTVHNTANGGVWVPTTAATSATIRN
ncbi:uncharacterized protein LOC134530028 [Bacillus rossius redtenbacheri]|uniref:uncharacterized protein LOC134530028 n=1 Tax=Bacillus rossius redtenbacheri TaxID=93214 RepID=UPI002FDE8D01